MQFPDKSIIMEITSDDKELIQKLKKRTIQLAILHTQPKESGIFYQRYIHENLCIYVPKEHPLARHKHVTIKDLLDYQIVTFRHLGFWFDLLQKTLPA